MFFSFYMKFVKIYRIIYAYTFQNLWYYVIFNFALLFSKLCFYIGGSFPVWKDIKLNSHVLTVSLIFTRAPYNNYICIYILYKHVSEHLLAKYDKRTSNILKSIKSKIWLLYIWHQCINNEFIFQPQHRYEALEQQIYIIPKVRTKSSTYYQHIG